MIGNKEKPNTNIAICHIPIIKPFPNVTPGTVATTTELFTSQRAPSNASGQTHQNLPFPLVSTPSTQVPPFLQGREEHKRGKHTYFRQMSRHHSEALHGLGLHTGLAVQPSLTPEKKIIAFVNYVFCNGANDFYF